MMVTATKQMCFSTRKNIEMSVLSLIETGDRNTVSSLYCLHGQKLQIRLRASLWLMVLLHIPQLSTLTERSLEEGKALNFFGSLPDKHKRLCGPSIQLQASCGITTSHTYTLATVN